MIKPGDVFGIMTSKGEAYFQYVAKKNTSSKIRVLPGTYSQLPDDIIEIVKQHTNFWTGFPVDAALKQKLIRKIGNFALPSHSSELPVFRSHFGHDANGEVRWVFTIDGHQMIKVSSELTEKEKKLPLGSTINFKLLIERIEDGWLPEKVKY